MTYRERQSLRDRKAHARKMREETAHERMFADGQPDKRRKKKGAGQPLPATYYGRVRVVSNIRSSNHYRERATLHILKIEEQQ